MTRPIMFHVATGAARREGREPSHDGEQLTILHDGDEYIADSNGGVAFTSRNEEEALDDYRYPRDSDEEYFERMTSDQEVLAEIRAGVAAGAGVPIEEYNGGEAVDIMRSWGWIEEEKHGTDKVWDRSLRDNAMAFLTVPEAARELGVSATSVTRWLDAGYLCEVRAQRRGVGRFVSAASVAVLKAHRETNPPKRGRKARGADPTDEVTN